MHYIMKVILVNSYIMKRLYGQYHAVNFWPNVLSLIITVIILYAAYILYIQTQ